MRRYVLAVLAIPLATMIRAQCPDGTPPPCRGLTPRGVVGPASSSVAVLYFSTRDSADTYLADGLTEEIATSLGRVPRLQVKSPSAVRRVQHANEGDLRAIGRGLNVFWVVEGSVRRAGDQLRVSARLVNAASETTTWSDAYTRPSADLLAIQADLAREVATGIAGRLAPAERRSLAAARLDPVAHDHLLRGNFQLARRSPVTIRRAIDEYEAAIAVDSTYARAWARLALGQALLRYWNGLADRHTAAAESTQVRGERAAARSLALDSSISDVWAALGYLRLYRDPIRMRGTLAAFRRAVALDPNSGEAHHQLGTGYLWHLDTVRARTELLRALELDPGRLVTYDNLASLSLIERRYDEVVRWTDSVIAVDPTHGYSYPLRAVAFAELGDTATAMRAVEASERVVVVPQLRFPRCVALGVMRLAAAAVACTRALGVAASAQDSALAYLGLGNIEGALDALESAATARAINLYVLMAEPFLDPLRTSPRFGRLVASLRPVEDPEP